MTVPEAVCGDSHVYAACFFCATIVGASVTLTNTAVTSRRQTIPTSPHVKKPKVWKHFRRRPFRAETDLYMAMLVVWCYSCRQTEDRCVCSYFQPPFLLPHDPLFPPPLPPSSSPNLGLIVSVIKHSWTDPSLNPLSSADYTGVRGLSSHRV